MTEHTAPYHAEPIGRARGLRLPLAAVAAILALLSGTASADCQVDPPDNDGDLVLCSGVDLDGFQAGFLPGEERVGLTVTVERGALVRNGDQPFKPALGLTQDSRVIVEETGRIEATAIGAAGVRAVDGEPDPANPGVILFTTVQNRGQITVNGPASTGIDLGNFGQVTNDGVISASGGQTTAIRVGDDGVAVNGFGADILVNGILAVGMEGGEDSQITNSSRILVQGPDAVGIRGGEGSLLANDGNPFGTIIMRGPNNVAIQAGSNHQSVNPFVNESIVNQGRIESTGDDSIGILVGDNNRSSNSNERAVVRNVGLMQMNGARATGISAGTSNFVSNSGSIEVFRGVDGTGIVVQSDTRVDNTGIIDAGGSASGEGINGVGVRLTGQNTRLNNRAAIRGGSGNGAAVVFEATTGPNHFTNERGAGISSTSGVAVRGSDESETVRNDGLIQGDVLTGGGLDSYIAGVGHDLEGMADGGAGTDLLSLLAGFDGGEVAVDLNSFRNFEELGVGALGSSSGGTSDFAGDFTISGTGTFVGGVQVAQGSLTLDGPVRIEGGDWLQESGTTLAGSASAQGPALDLAGAMTIEPGTTLRVSEAGFVADGETLTLVRAGGGVTGTFDTVESVPSLFVGFSDLYTANAVLVTAARVPYVTAANGTFKNQSRMARHLDGITAGTIDADLRSALGVIDTLDAAGAQRAFDALHGEVYDAHTHAAVATGGLYARLLAERPLRCERLGSSERPDMISLEPCSEQGFTPWATGFGRFGDRNARPGFAGYDTAGGGISFGVDYRPDDLFLFSGQLGTSRHALDFDDSRGDGSATSLDLGVGAAWTPGDSHVRFALEYGHGWHDTRRRIRFPGLARLATSDYDSDRVTLLLEAGHQFRLGGLAVEPFAALDYTHIAEDSINESDAGSVGLRVDSRDSDLVATDAGVRLSTAFVKSQYAAPYLEWADGVWRPELKLLWRQVWNDYDRSFDVRLKGAAGAPKAEIGAQDAQYGGEVGFKLNFQPHGTRTNLSLGYDVFYGDRTLIQTVGARVNVPF